MIPALLMPWLSESSVVPAGLPATLRLKNFMSVRTFLKLAVPRHAITSVPLGTHPSAHCMQCCSYSSVTPQGFAIIDAHKGYIKSAVRCWMGACKGCNHG